MAGSRGPRAFDPRTTPLAYHALMPLVRRFATLLAVVVLVSATAACEPVDRLSVQVVGRVLVDQNWRKIQLRGVNRPGLEFRCVQDIPYGFLTDDNDQAGQSIDYARTAVAALDAWDDGPDHAINTVRVPLNEGCWLGLEPGPYSGAPYRAFVRALVDELTASGRYTILDLHWSAPAPYRAIGQDVGPNREHSLPFWTQVADEYKDTPSVMFDLFNEPRLWCWTPSCYGNYAEAVSVGWGCYRNGCTYTYKAEDHALNRFTGDTIDIVGTQELLEAIRNTGARNVVIVEGLGWGNALDAWTRYMPTDLTRQVAASIHTYTSSGANARNLDFLDGSLANGGLSSRFPIVVGEFGEWMCSGVSDGFTEVTMDWADLHGYSYTAWGWDRNMGCDGPSLVTSNDHGDPSPYGQVVKDHLVGLSRGRG